MARTKQSAAKALEAAQEAQEQQDLSQDIQEQEAAQTVPETAQEGSAAQEVIGPDDPAELLGCEDEPTDEAELMDGLLVEFAVTPKGGLRLRAEPSLDAPVVAILPCGAGVLADDEPEDGWVHVRTGWLDGWMLADRLEALSLAAYGTD